MPGLCHSWKSAAFLVILAACLEAVCFVGFLAVFNGGYARRQTGWKILSFLLFLIGIILAIPLASFPSDSVWFIWFLSGCHVFHSVEFSRKLMSRSDTVTYHDVNSASTSTEHFICVSRMESRCKLDPWNSKLFACVGRWNCRWHSGEI